MFDSGDIIDHKYYVNGLCSDEGGMGTLLFVTYRNGEENDEQLVLKYCKESEEEYIKRFKREVRLLSGFDGNSKIIQLIDFNINYDPPYFVMKYYPRGDLFSLSSDIRNDYELQEKKFNEMIQCIGELHAHDIFHRDIKPQNFLLDTDNIIVTDFGLSMEVESETAFTRSSMYWGTHGYIPPEFQRGGFKNADAAGDIFMLGKSFYALITSRDPVYLVDDDVPPPVFHIIERCCALDKSARYQTLSELRQSLKMAYDVLLKRAGGVGEIRQLLTAIMDRLEQEKKYRSKDVINFIEKFALLNSSDKIKLCFELKRRIFRVIRQKPIVDHLESFLDSYRELVESNDYSWSYAETIALNMKVLFYGDDVPNRIKSKALELAIDAAYRMNRFAAMDTCTEMITKITDEELGLAVSDVLLRAGHTFIANIEPSECENEIICKQNF